MSELSSLAQPDGSVIQCVGHVQANYSQPRTCLSVHVHRILRRIHPIFYMALILLAAPEDALAHDVFSPIEQQSCGYKKAYGVVARLIAVYASHILTIRLEPGLGTYPTIYRYIWAAVLPAATAAVAVRDLLFRRHGFQYLPSDDSPNARHFKNMQKAINAGAACLKVERSQIPRGFKGVLAESCKVRGRKPLNDDGTEVFISIPRGTPAKHFAPTLIEGSSQLLKAVLGAIQLALATLQLISASNPRVAAYGCGSFVYTIIPYAIGSSINMICAILTPAYVDIAEMELASDPESQQGLFVSPVFN